ncbi:MAG TPA: hypothetical protein VEC19_11625 [Usitatibacter sp.]|nr:hypothetical protein [Usitatibacter sp.]
MNIFAKALRCLAAALAAIVTACSARAAPAETGIAETRLAVECSIAAQRSFDLGYALLEARAYQLALRAFGDSARIDPDCAMAQWGLAMANLGDEREVPAAPRVAAGARAVQRAKALGGKTEKECDLIDAVAEYFHRHSERSHAMRLVQYERAMRTALERSPGDAEVRSLHGRAFETLVAH